MPLKLRRGTDSNRSSITPAEGEPIFTTDTKKLYVGDGSTAGGIAIDTNVTDGDKGDITVSSSGATWTIDNDAVTYAKIQNVSAASRLLGRGSASGSGDVQELTIGSGLTLTGTELSASGGLGSPTAIVTKTANETVTSSTTFQDDDELYYALSANKDYYIQLYLRISRVDTSATPAMKVAIYANSEGYGAIIGGTPSNSIIFDGTTSLGQSGNLASLAGVPISYFIQGTVKTTSAYTLQFKFAQNTSVATGITVMAKSRLMIWEL